MTNEHIGDRADFLWGLVPSALRGATRLYNLPALGEGRKEFLQFYDSENIQRNREGYLVGLALGSVLMTFDIGLTGMQAIEGNFDLLNLHIATNMAPLLSKKIFEIEETLAYWSGS